MSQFATRFKHRQHTENITDDDECPIHLFNYPWSNKRSKDQVPFPHVPNTNINILLNSVWLSLKSIYIRDPDTLLQLLIKNKAYYLQIKAGLLRISWKIFANHSCFAKKTFLNFATSESRRPHPTLCVSKTMNSEPLETQNPAKNSGRVGLRHTIANKQ